MAESLNPSTAMATTIIDELVRNGVTDVVVCPGSRSTALAIAAVRRDGLTVHVRLDERSAGFLALGLARGSGRPAAVVTTSGTAVANLVPAVAEADMAGVPLMVLSADRPIELHGVGANQTLSQARLFDGLVRWSVDLPAPSGAVGEPRMWRSTVARAVAVAQGTGAGQLGQTGVGGSGGPVHCNLAFREPTVPGLDDGRSVTQAYPHAIDGRPDGLPWTTHVAAAGAPGLRGIVGDLLEMCECARVLVVAGDSYVPMQGLDRLPWPVIAEPTAGTHAEVGLPHGSLLVASSVWRDAHRPDVVVRLGHPTLSRAALVELADIPTIQITASGAVDPARSATTAIIASPAAVVAGLLDAVHESGSQQIRPQGAGVDGTGAAGVGSDGSCGQSGRGRSGRGVGVAEGWMEEWRRGSDVAAGVVARHLDGDDAPEPAVARRVVAASGRRPLVVASSLPIRDVADFAGFAGAGGTGGRVHANRGLAGIDGFISTAVGVALASGPTVALAGDLSFLHDHNGLLVEDPSAVDLDVVVVDNDGGGLFHHVPAVQVPEFERVFATPHGRDLEAVARAAGADASTAGVDDVAGLVARSPGGLRVVVVPTDRQRGAHVRRAIRADLEKRFAGDVDQNSRR